MTAIGTRAFDHDPDTSGKEAPPAHVRQRASFLDVDGDQGALRSDCPRLRLGDAPDAIAWLQDYVEARAIADRL